MSESTLKSPFMADEKSEAADCQLVTDALAGSQEALEGLIARHQPWIYNLAFRMVMVREDAEDVTQEVLVKMVTKLASYDPDKAAFRTWLYRIVTNHVINMKTRGYERGITGFEQYYSFVSEMPDQDPDASPETKLIVADLAVGCVMGTLLCLERTQRVVFILAVGFNVSDVMGAEILDMSRDTFRKTLSRARAKLQQYMSGNCSLLNPEAPCHCRKKVKAVIDSGAYSTDNTDNLVYHRADRPRLREIVGEKMERFGTEIYEEFAALFREHPFYSPPEMTSWLRELLGRKSFREFLQLDESGGATS
jgi:RNA polymerase sigma factor (sigma-70 family)